jgi:hypothetical protein
MSNPRPATDNPLMSVRPFLCLAVVLTALALAGGGCGTSPAGPARAQVEIHIREDGRMLIDGRTSALARLGRSVRRAGATPQTTIHVVVTDRTDQATLVTVTRTLREAGYTRILFSRPRKATATIVSP